MSNNKPGTGVVALSCADGLPDTMIYMKHCGVCGDTLYGPLSLDACPDCRQWEADPNVLPGVIVIDDLAPLIERERAHRARFFTMKNPKEGFFSIGHPFSAWRMWDHPISLSPINPRGKQFAQVFGASLSVFLVGCLMAAALLLTGCDRSEWRAQQWEINDKLCARHGSAVRQERVGCGFSCANTMVTCADGHQITRR